MCQTKNYAGLPAGEPVERQAHGGRDSPDVCPAGAQWALKLTFIAAVAVDFACLLLLG